MDFKNATPMNKLQYANEWSKNSSGFEKRNFYTWMASTLPSATRALEIGCGAGFSTLEIAKKVPKVICVEVNEHLASKAEEYLTSHGVSTSVAKSVNGKYQETSSRVDIFILNLFDVAKFQVFQQASFDMLICWFIGSDPYTIANGFNLKVEDLEPSHMARYRNKVHKDVYDAGRQLLSNGGNVSIIDRGLVPFEVNIDDVKNYLLDLHLDVSSGNYNRGKAEIKFIDTEFKSSQLQYVAEQSNPQGNKVLNSVVMIKR
ncbi:O-methyltransferase [Vibrio owensii]